MELKSVFQFLVFFFLPLVRGISLLSPEIPGCGKGQAAQEEITYLCPDNSSLPDVIFSYVPHYMVKIQCFYKESLKLFMDLNLEIIKNIPYLSIVNCAISADFSIGEFAQSIGMRRVLALMLVNVQLSDTLKAKNFYGLKNLNRLELQDVNHIKLSHFESDLLAETPNLVHLHLSSNNGNISNKFLDFSESIPPNYLEPLQKLNSLIIESTKFVRIEEHTFDNLIELSNITILSPLKDIEPRSFYRLKKLTNITLSNFWFTNLPNDLFKSNKNLTHVKLFDNNAIMEEVPDGFFANLSRLLSCEMRHLGLKKLPRNLFQNSHDIKYIDFADNLIDQLPQDIFHGLSNLRKLSIRGNLLESISKYLFRDLRSLEILDLTENNIYVIKNYYFISLTSVQEIYLKANNMNEINSSAFSLLRNIKIVDLSYNNLTFSNFKYYSPFKNCLNLKNLNLGYNRISKIYYDWFKNSKLEELNLEHNEIEHLKTLNFIFASQNITVNLRNNIIKTIKFDEPELLRLKAYYTKQTDIVIDLNENNSTICDCNLYNFKKFLENKLSDIMLKLFTVITDSMICSVGNKQYFIDQLKSEDFTCRIENTNETECPQSCDCKFSPEKNAVLIDCANRRLTEAPSMLYNIYSSNRSIHLNLTNNQLTSLPSKNQQNYDLVTELYASNNKINLIEPNNILPHLEVLDLSYNNLKLMKNTVLSAIESSKAIRRLQLNNNPWTCSCDSAEFLSFIQRQYNIISNPLNVYCLDTNKPFVHVTISDVCSTFEFTIITTVIFASFSVLLLFIFVLYLYRSEIKIWFYTHQYCLHFITENDLDKNKFYDAFISYSHKDESFVLNELVQKLESSPRPYKLCLHYRDWLAGDYIPSQIARSVQNSKRTIVVLSKNFLTSVWGVMEFREAHYQALAEGRKRIILIIYGEILSDENLDTELKAYIKTHTYILWGDKWFWEKLRYAMPRN